MIYILGLVNNVRYSVKFFDFFLVWVKLYICVDDVKVNIGNCLVLYNIDLEIFIVNVIYDCSNMIGSWF